MYVSGLDDKAPDPTSFMATAFAKNIDRQIMSELVTPLDLWNKLRLHNHNTIPHGWEKIEYGRAMHEDDGSPAFFGYMELYNHGNLVAIMKMKRKQ